MRFLKNKIALARNFHAQAVKKPSKAAITELPSLIKSSSENSETRKRKRIPGQCLTPEVSRQTKNIVKNYGKAISKFSTSSLAMSYLTVFLQREGVDLAGFFSFVNKNKGSIDGLQHFRMILLEDKHDDKDTAAYKRVFRDIGAIFIKFFSVNWIYHSKVQHKEAHLKFRFKMLRRIRNPEMFTYLKVTKGNKKHKALSA